MSTNARDALRLSAALAVVLALSACQTKPTRTSTSESRAFSNQPVQITPQTIVVDARPAFDYSTAHIPHSVPIAWSDYVEAEPAQRGIIQRDTFAAARRLARLGLAPESKVVVLGRGYNGGGEEGRVAWMLAYLGVRDVQFAAIDSLKPRLTNAPESQPPPSVPIWKPTPDFSLDATKDEVLFAINQNGVAKPVSYKGAPARLYRFIDVRTERAYLGKEGLGALKHVPDMGAINIPWQQFFTPSMRVNGATMKQLSAMGYTPSERIIIVSEDGVSSAAVTMAFRQAGYVNTANYSGGLQDLIP
jgi:thiosulfate/3-mercaptopyruvate sulfurtransferase